MRDPVLINTVGHSAGLLLFGLILILLVRDWRAHGVRQTRLSLAAAALALFWNAGSLIALASHNPATVVILSFSALSLLPAVLLQVALKEQRRPIALAGYLVSTSAVILHFADLPQLAVVLIAGGFGLLTLIAFFLTRREWISLGCLLLFTSSFLHFGYQHVSSPWAAEITWHHVGIPVVLIVLLQDYRFLLLDAFVRFLVNFGLAATYIAALLLLNRKFLWWDAIRSSMFSAGIALVAICLSLILFAYLRNALQVWVGRVIFRQRRVEDCMDAIGNVALAARSEEELLSGAAAEVARHLGADRFAVPKDSKNGGASDGPSVLFGAEPSERAQIPLRFSSGDVRYLVTGARRGGRRYLSEDLEDMRRLGAAIVEQVERFRAEELRRLASEAELRALQAQINPHFLFNALNTLYGTIDRTSHEARRMVLNLADIFRYFLQGDRVTIPLSEELRIVEAYLEIEKLRLGDRLETALIVDPEARAAMIPILSIQPLVENAVKHGISAKEGRGRVSVSVSAADTGLCVRVEDTGVGFAAAGGNPQEGTGLGLENVRRRLALYYGPSAELTIRSSADGTTVSFLIPILVRAATHALTMAR
ncbi:MAG TPA: histidine kinase [Bryobacteraceae bacterium]